MAWFKRIFLFLAVNILVVTTISLILNLLGVQPYLSYKGIDPKQLIIFCFVWGMGGAFISLLISKFMAKMMMGVQVIDPQTHDHELAGLVSTVYRLAQIAGLSKMPEVGIYESPDVNAFATGPSKSHALVAVSTGLLRSMDKRSVEGVLAHELTHVANGDMVTMTLIQGIVNSFVMFLARIIAFFISNALRSKDDDRGGGMSHFAYSMTVFFLEMVFMILGSMVVAWFSRLREYRADRGGAKLAGRESMISALRSLKRVYERFENAGSAPSATVQTLQISGRENKWLSLFSTHPSLDERIARLESMTHF